MVYRTVPNEPRVTLRFGAYTFALRLRANFPAALRQTLMFAALSVVVVGGGELLLSLAWDVRGTDFSRLHAFGIAAGAGSGRMSRRSDAAVPSRTHGCCSSLHPPGLRPAYRTKKSEGRDGKKRDHPGSLLRGAK
jgi:hypothetical protein